MPPELLAIVTQLTEALDARGTRWCVLRNYDSFPAPRTPTSDLDILVDCKLATVLELLGSLQTDAGAALTRVVEHIDGQLVGLSFTASNGQTLRLDLASALAWRGVEILPAAEILAATRQLPACRAPAKEHEAILMLMSSLLYRGEVKDAYREIIHRVAAADGPAFLKPLATPFGSAVAARIQASAAAGDWNWFECNAGRLQRTLALRGLRRNPIGQSFRWLRMGAGLAHRWLRPPGLWVAFLGPDGAGKSTLLAAFRTALATLYFPEKQHHFHWRPQLLPAPAAMVGMSTSGSLAGATAPHAAAPRGRLSSLARLLYFWLDYVLGAWGRVRPMLARGGLVTFDRYFYDFAIDPRRYRLRASAAIVRALGRLVPKPELVFVLHADASVLAARKQELAPEELQRQLVALRELAHRDSNLQLIDVNRSVDETVQALLDITRRHLDARERRRIGWPQGREPRTALL